MKVILDCEFTQLNAQAKLISLALVAEDGREFYVEIQDAYKVEDCSDFVKANVLPQLNGGEWACSFGEAQYKLAKFLGAFKEALEICSDAPEWDWELFCDLAYVDNRWPNNVSNRPINLIELYNQKADQIEAEETPELPHHALLDARLLSNYYAKYIK